MSKRPHLSPHLSSLAAMVGVALLLGACAEGGGLFAGLGGGEGQAAGGTANGDEGKAAGESAKAGESQQASLPPPPPIDTPKALIGRESEEVTKLLGKPAFARRDGGAEIWQYRGKACILDVFLYKGQLGRLVEHAELRRRDEGEISDRDCLADVLAGAEGGDAS